MEFVVVYLATLWCYDETNQSSGLIFLKTESCSYKLIQ